MAEIWFDPNKQRCLGPPISDEENPENVLLFPLGALLEANPFPYRHGDLPKISAERWDREKVLSVGKIAVSALESEGPTPLTTKHMSRLAILGLLPYRDVYNKYFETFSEYKRAAGSVPGYDRVTYADWGTADFVEYAERTSELIGRLPQIVDYKRQFLEGKGPSFKLINNRIGGIKPLHELLGYPNTHDWIEDDFVTWGIRVMRANPDKDFSLHMVEILSHKKRGPSVWSVYQKIEGGWAGFRKRVLQETSKQFETEAESRLRNIDQYNVLLDNGELAVPLIDSPEDLLCLGGRYKVMKAIAADLTEAQTRQVLASRSEAFIAQLRKLRPQITAGYVEMIAVSEHVFDDIWPSVSSAEYLHVPQEQIDDLRRKHSSKKMKARKVRKN